MTQVNYNNQGRDKRADFWASGTNLKVVQKQHTSFEKFVSDLANQSSSMQKWTKKTCNPGLNLGLTGEIQISSRSKNK